MKTKPMAFWDVAQFSFVEMCRHISKEGTYLLFFSSAYIDPTSIIIPEISYDFQAAISNRTLVVF